MLRSWSWALLTFFIGAAPAAQPSDTFEVSGRVVLGGLHRPRSTTVVNTTDPDECGREHDLGEFVFSPGSRGLGNVVVTLHGVPAQLLPQRSPETLVIDNRGCRFEPHVAVAVVGDSVEALNSDAVLHTTHLYGATEVNIALPFVGSRSTRRIDDEGIIIVKCDVHGWMQAFVWVDSHPYHAVSRPDGSFRIAGLPPGDYVLEAWHERLGRRRQTIHVDGDSREVTVEYPGDDLDDGDKGRH